MGSFVSSLEVAKKVVIKVVITVRVSILTFLDCFWKGLAILEIKDMYHLHFIP